MSVAEAPTIRPAFDIGGTFTDIVITASDGRVFTYKVLSTPDEIAGRVAGCIQDVLGKVPDGRVEAIVHGTTIASNAVIENKRAMTGYITTRGFRDDVTFPRPRYQLNMDAFGLNFPNMTPLVPRSLRHEVDERISASGAIDRPLDAGEVEEVVLRLVGQGIEALAICLINAHMNPVHEQQIEAIARRIAPQLEVVTSHAVSPAAGEYERASTTVFHASLKPVVKQYLERLQADLRDYPDFVIMQANGGVVPVERAKLRPANLIESGPAAGVLAAAALARECDIESAVSLDMGGTTVKVCLVERGRPRETVQLDASVDPANRLVRGSGHALRTAGFDLVEIGAGGGSIAWIDGSGGLRVGPHSAGAQPGPACYGLGGSEPTITDAAVVLGYLNPAGIAGGTVPIDATRAWQAIEERIALPAKLSVPEAAYGICRVAIASMRRAVRMVTVERGCDPRGCSLIAFGGAAPLLAAELAGQLEVGTVYIPPHAGLFSALGLLTADMRFDYIAPLAGDLSEIDGQVLIDRFAAMRADIFRDLERSGLDAGGLDIEHSLDLRYARQASETTIRLPDAADAAALITLLGEAFHREHERQFGYARPESRILLSTIRSRALLKRNVPPLSHFELGRRAGDAPPVPARTAWFEAGREGVEVAVHRRAEIADRAIAGPAIIEDFDTTIVVPPGWRATCGKLGSIVLEHTT